MRVPDNRLYKRSDWQRFFAGLAIGAIISWGVFLALYGMSQDARIKYFNDRKEEFEDLKRDKEIWMSEKEALNKENKRNLLIQDIKVRVATEQKEKYKLDSYSAYLIQESAKEEIEYLISKNIEDVYNSNQLLKKAIENKEYKIDKMLYTVEVHEILFYTTLSVQLKIKSVKKII
ncbi:sporulation membrane protein YtrI [Metabacillus iocasae]|uniref:Gas vesicle protein n=1 Tax=Priestia iocasae TaxID=2291674 RepID=A0ABS2QPT0_9BACI|nr:sporulation membrane protein YtrI [Metabacillus iocasae]MBM7701223.1 gas vesicle protein [Metabacillus iocasae]